MGRTIFGLTGEDANDKLPDFCFGMNDKGEICGIYCGFSKAIPFGTDEFELDFLNAQINVSKQCAAAMEGGLHFGWQSVYADPDNYDESGKYINLANIN